MYKFGGTVSVIETSAESLAAVKALKNEKVLGFDTETRASFKKNQRYDVALLQLATETHAYLFRLNKFPLNPELTAILADPGIVKAGVAIRDDVKVLQKRLDFEDKNFVDLAKVAKEKKNRKK